MIRRNIAAALAATIFAGTLLTADAVSAAEWTLDPAASRLGFAGTQAGNPFEGRFQQFDAEIRFDAADLSHSTVVVVIEMASAETGNAARDEAVRGADWFNVAQFPQARFETTQIRALADDRYEADATLSIRDVTKLVRLPFSLQTTSSGTRAVGNLTINRVDYGVGQGQWASPQMVAHDVQIRFDLRATPIP